MTTETGPDDHVRNHLAWFKANKQKDILIRCQLLHQDLESGLNVSRMFTCVNTTLTWEKGRKIYTKFIVCLSRVTS